jgi:hypothetical protein
MSDIQSFEDRFASRLRTYALGGAAELDREAVARAVAAGVATRSGGAGTRIRRRWLDQWRRGVEAPPTGRRVAWDRPGIGRTAIGQVALVVVVALAVLVGVAIWAGVGNQVVGPGETPRATTTPQVSGPTTSWPGPVRQEPGGLPVRAPDVAPDPVGDAGQFAPAYVDIVSVQAQGQLRLTNEFRLAGPPPAVLDGRRIAYGVVIDRDGDGVPDLRAGVESVGTARMVWMMDLNSGESASCECVFARLTGDDLNVEMWHPSERDDDITGGFAFRRAPSNLPTYFYVWASVMEGDEVVATDYAPDSGWLEIPGRVNPDRPGPLRPEPVGGAPGVVGDQGSHTDPIGDAGTPPVELVDIVQVEYRQGCWLTLTTEACVSFDVAAELPMPLPDPGELWLGYGLVVDTDGDGAGDWRYGMDNVGNDDVQMWRTDLATGVTQAAPVGVAEDPDLMDVVLPPQVGSDVASGHIYVPRDEGQGFRFYVWASTVSDGTGAVDYAPDSGWLDPATAP